MFKKIPSMVLSFTLTAGMLAGCGGGTGDQQASAGSKDEKEVKIGILGARSGTSASLGQYLDGALAAIDHVNEQGGLNGYTFKAVVRDDEANPTKSKELVKELIHKEEVSVIIGPTNTSNALAILPEVFSAKVPLIDPVATGTKIGEEAKKLSKSGKNYFFRTTTPDEAQADAIVDYLVKQGYSKPVILHDETAYGKGGLEELQKSLGKSGVKPIKEIGFPMNSPDLTPQVLEATNTGADVILVWALGQDQAQIAKAKHKLGKNITMIGCTSLQTANFRKLAGEAANGTLSVWPADHVREKKQGDRPERIQTSYDVYKEFFPDGYNLDDAGSMMFAYDAAMVAMNAIAHAGNDPVAIRDAIESLPHKNIASKDLIQYSPNQHEVWKKEDFSMIIVEKGKLFELNQ